MFRFIKRAGEVIWSPVVTFSFEGQPFVIANPLTSGSKEMYVLIIPLQIVLSNDGPIGGPNFQL